MDGAIGAPHRGKSRPICNFTSPHATDPCAEYGLRVCVGSDGSPAARPTTDRSWTWASRRRGCPAKCRSAARRLPWRFFPARARTAATRPRGRAASPGRRVCDALRPPELLEDPKPKTQLRRRWCSALRRCRAGAAPGAHDGWWHGLTQPLRTYDRRGGRVATRCQPLRRSSFSWVGSTGVRRYNGKGSAQL